LLSAHSFAARSDFPIVSDAVLSRRWNNAVRGYAFGVFAMLATYFAAQLFTYALQSASFALAPGDIGNLFPLIGYALQMGFIVAFYPVLASGRLGGRLNGWWWQRRPQILEQPANGG
jgi:hypothetical protein